jgi:phasin family protein
MSKSPNSTEIEDHASASKSDWMAGRLHDGHDMSGNTTHGDAGISASEGAEAIKARVVEATEAGNQVFKDATEKSMATLDDLNAQSRKNLEAVVASITATAKCAEALGIQTMTFAKTSMEGNAAAAKALASARSIQDVVELQTDFARSLVGSYASQMIQVSEIVCAAVKDGTKPLSERATTMMEAAQSKA